MPNALISMKNEVSGREKPMMKLYFSTAIRFKS